MVVIGAIGIGVALILALLATAGVSGIASSAALVPAVGVLGLGATTAAISIAVAAGGVGVLNKLRDYKLEKLSSNKIRLTKK